MSGRIVYLHGFASGPSSSKAQHFRRFFAARGIELAIPALDGGDFTRLTLSGQLRIVESVCGAATAAGRPPEPLVLIGSSMGGYLSALYAAQHPEVDALILMAPAFDFARRWRERLGPDELTRWERTGEIEIEHYAYKRRLPLRIDLLRDAERHEPWPQVTAPTLVLHGRRDDVVPESLVRTWVERTPSARLLLFDAGHELTECLDELVEEARRHLLGVPKIAAAFPGLA